MLVNTLLAIGSVDGRYREITQPLDIYVSEFGLMKYRVMAECVYLLKLSERGVTRKFNDGEKDFLANLWSQMTVSDAEEIKVIESTTKHDVNAMINWLKQKCASEGLGDVAEKIHYLLTSEDINNIAYRWQIKEANEKIILPSLRKIMMTLMMMAEKYCRIPMLARTHGQAAVTTTVGKELGVFLDRLIKEYTKMKKFRFTGKSNGAVGNFNAHYLLEKEIDWIDFSSDYITQLDLIPNLITTQINPAEDIVEYFQILQRMDNILIDLAQDTWRYISDDWFKQVNKKGEVGSSTMAQKVNPIDFENAEGNFFMANGLIAAIVNKLSISRLQRDLSDSTVIRHLGTIFGDVLVGLTKINNGLGKVSPNEMVMSEALNRNWGILSEAVQLKLRKETNLPDPYTLVKEFVRGRLLTSQNYADWISSLDIELEVCNDLLLLTPESYFGVAPQLTEMLIAEAGALLII